MKLRAIIVSCVSAGWVLPIIGSVGGLFQHLQIPPDGHPHNFVALHFWSLNAVVGLTWMGLVILYWAWRFETWFCTSAQQRTRTM